MSFKRGVGIATGVVAMAWSAAVGGVEVEPVYDVQLLGGQAIVSGGKDALSGDVSARATPALRLSEHWSLVPTLSTSYQGTRQVVDLIGTGVIVQELWDNRIGVRGVYADKESRWKFKPNAGFMGELAKDAKDESWGKGLYDYRIASLGLEAEYVYLEPFTARFSLDYYYTAFPNYSSLESQAGADPITGAPLARELAASGVLNNHVRSALVGLSYPLKDRLVLDASYAFSYQTFPQQRVVDATGNLQNALRYDCVNSLSMGLRLPSELNPDLKLLGGFELSAAYDASNQNSFDAQRLQFIPHFYNYGELRLGPSVKALAGDPREPVVFSLGAAYWRRWYPYRFTQNASGTYLEDTLTQNNWMLAASLAYPMAPHFSLLFNFQFGQASSNEGFQQVYAYDYTAANYMFGFAYGY